jgi:hypothetical protein
MVVFKMPMCGGIGDGWDKKRCYFKKRTRGVIDNKRSAPKTNPNEPKNEAGKLLKIRICGKTNPKTNPAMLLKINVG